MEAWLLLSGQRVAAPAFPRREYDSSLSALRTVVSLCSLHPCSAAAPSSRGSSMPPARKRSHTRVSGSIFRMAAALIHPSLRLYPDQATALRKAPQARFPTASTFSLSQLSYCSRPHPAALTHTPVPRTLGTYGRRTPTRWGFASTVCETRAGSRGQSSAGRSGGCARARRQATRRRPVVHVLSRSESF